MLSHQYGICSLALAGLKLAVPGCCKGEIRQCTCKGISQAFVSTATPGSLASIKSGSKLCSEVISMQAAWHVTVLALPFACHLPAVRRLPMQSQLPGKDSACLIAMHGQWHDQGLTGPLRET